MKNYFLKIHLRSEATFGRGDGVAGLIDQEVEHDALGFPYLRGRTLKGMLSEECDNIIAVLPNSKICDESLKRLFGVAGSTTDTLSQWHFGDAQLPEDLRQAVAADLKRGKSGLKPTDILESLTTIRRQTSINAQSGAPEAKSLRSMRVIMRGLTLTSHLVAFYDTQRLQQDVQLLVAGCLALRHAGSGRNRGRGWVSCTLHDEQGIDITEQQFKAFATQINEKE